MICNLRPPNERYDANFAILQKHNLHIVDLDLIAREVVNVESTRSRILKTFPQATGQPIPGSSVPAIDRAKLGSIIFSDKTARSTLNSLMRWPIMQTTILAILKAYIAGYSCIVVDAPLLFESGLDKFCSVTLTVFIEKEEDQVKRLLDRDLKLVAASGDPNKKPLTESEAKDRIHAQMSTEQKRKKSTYEVENSSSIQALENQVDVLLSNIRSKHRAWLPRNSLIVYLVTLFFLALMYLAYRYA